MTTRNDRYSPSNLVPAEFEFLFDFATSSAEGLDVSYNLDVLRDSRATGKHWRKPDWNGGCHVCGAQFKAGSVFEHVSGERIVVGWECAEKIAAGLDHSGALIALGRARAKAKAASIAAARAAEAKRFLAENPGLEQALATDHRITRDLAASLAQWGHLSEKQVNLARKIADDVAAPKAATVPVPKMEGRVQVVGKIITKKLVETAYGVSDKMLIEVQAEGGVYRLWGTDPRGLRAEVGDVVSFEAAVEQSQKDSSFGFFSRPTKPAVFQLAQ